MNSRVRAGVWVAIAVAGVLILVRVGIALSVGRDLDQSAGIEFFDVVIVAVLISVLIAAAAVVVPGWSRAAGLDELAATFTDAAVVPLTISRSQGSVIESIGVVAHGFHPPQELKGVLSDKQVGLWKGRQLQRVASIDADEIEYRVGTFSTYAGTFPALVVVVRQGDRTTEFEVFPLNRSSKLIPRQLTSEQLEEVVQRVRRGK